MNPQRCLLLVVIALCVLDLLDSHVRRQTPVGLRILIRAQISPQLAEGLARYLILDMALRRGTRLRIDLLTDGADDEVCAVRSILLREGFLEEQDGREPDLVFVV